MHPGKTIDKAAGQGAAEAAEGGVAADKPAAPRSGRPPALTPEDRRSALLVAADRVFERDGFSGATMEGIAAEAGMSKRTLYRFFPDKLSALEALLGAHDHRPPLQPYGYRPGEDPRPEIRRTLIALVTFLLQPKQIGLMRLVIAEANRHPEISESFDRLEFSSVMERMTGRFERLRADGAISGDDPVELVRMMLGAIMGPRQISALARHPAPPPDIEEITRRTDRVIEVFAPSLGLPPA